MQKALNANDAKLASDRQNRRATRRGKDDGCPSVYPMCSSEFSIFTITTSVL